MADADLSADCAQGFHVRCHRHGGCECACHDDGISEGQRDDWEAW